MHNKALTQMIQRALRLACLLLTAAAPAFLSAAAPQAPDVPGVVIDYSPASSGLYIGSPGLPFGRMATTSHRTTFSDPRAVSMS